jgi:hypothetical protein
VVMISASKTFTRSRPLPVQELHVRSHVGSHPQYLTPESAA